MPAPTKRTEEAATKILEYLEAGNTRKASFEAAGIDDNTFYRWIEDDEGFRDSVTRAESRCEVTYGAILKKAATGFDSGQTTETTETIFKKRKTISTDPTTGVKTIIEEEVPYTVKRVTVTTSRDFDWRSAESWLKRRRKGDWSERQEVSGPDGKDIPMIGYNIIEPPATKESG